MSTFNGLSPNGTWTLEVADRDVNDIGTLNNWTLQVNSGERQTTSNASGVYSFDVLPNGSYTAMSVLPSGWSASGVNQHAVTVSGAGVFTNRDFGSGFNNRAYVNVFNDLDADGIVDGGEAGLSGRTVYRDVNSNGEKESEATGDPWTAVSHRQSLLPMDGQALIWRTALNRFVSLINRAGTTRSRPTA